MIPIRNYHSQIFFHYQKNLDFSPYSQLEANLISIIFHLFFISHRKKTSINSSIFIWR